ncbi:hypothetical protein [Halocalculus aciditolerans]|uniref:Uncharacterized protein n=1 Tax=Halocalculus aciditolerans TaxID=1383812 RepID=A0A830FH37_9EURY|nr:hypothetical protein [Halocalculus aciditolerans]GGL55365.1 hypothetical protein GCM10009039_11870 [Halocalculus aciditolerans]
MSESKQETKERVREAIRQALVSGMDADEIEAILDDARGDLDRVRKFDQGGA